MTSLQKNDIILISGCPCHLAHITANNANDAFCEYIGINVENVLVDLFYWFDESAKRKGKRKEHFEFCDEKYLRVLKHSSLRWLSLEKCVLSRVISKYKSLKSYFLRENIADDRFKYLNEKISNILLEPVRLFHSSAISLFTHFSLLLQREESTIHIL